MIKMGVSDCCNLQPAFRLQKICLKSTVCTDRREGKSATVVYQAKVPMSNEGSEEVVPGLC